MRKMRDQLTNELIAGFADRHSFRNGMFLLFPLNQISAYFILADNR